jgi:hypothetical protein
MAQKSCQMLARVNRWWGCRITRTCRASGTILLSVVRWALILSRRRRSASLWIFRALASVALLPDPDDDDNSGAAGGTELACRGSRTGPTNTDGSQPSYGCSPWSSFPSCIGWHAAIQPSITSPAGSLSLQQESRMFRMNQTKRQLHKPEQHRHFQRLKIATRIRVRGGERRSKQRESFSCCWAGDELRMLTISGATSSCHPICIL